MNFYCIIAAEKTCDNVFRHNEVYGYLKTEEWVMKKKIKFEPQEMLAEIVNAVSSAYLLNAGIPKEHAAVIGNALGGTIKGFSLSSNGSTNGILKSINTAIKETLDSPSFELTYQCREALENEAFSPIKLVEFLCKTNAHDIIKEQILRISKQDPDCDINTFPANEIASEIIKNIKLEILDNHELATYAVFCILSNSISSPPFNVANQQYIDCFVEPLFLHRDPRDERVSLKNLFVMPKCKSVENANVMTANLSENCQQRIMSFIQHSEDTSFLFIEGDAGCGKTTLVAWMNYHYYLKDEIAEQVFGERPLLTIRLRDLDKEEIAKKQSLSSAIRKYMNIESWDDLEKMFPRAIMVLDGFDELCMIEGMNSDHNELIYDLYRKQLNDFKIIVTTRPKFVSYNIVIPFELIFLKHFDFEQQESWIKQYTSEDCCGQTIDDNVRAYIASSDDDTSACICDTPMTLYMLAARKGTSAFLDNNWAIYHHIFHEELSETEYNKMFPDPDRNYSHDIFILRDVLYQVSEEIAYQMYQERNSYFFLSDNKLSNIINELSDKNSILKKANMKDIAEHCYALCCYWKSNADRGAVEFLHNNIRDFFLAEKIYREMNEITEIIKCSEKPSVILAKKLCTLFEYFPLERKVTEFIFLRAKYNVENGISDFATYEMQVEMLGDVIYKIQTEGILESKVLTKYAPITPLQKMVNILTCTAQLYRHAYEAHLSDKEYILWWGKYQVQMDINSMLKPLFKTIFCLVPVTITSEYMITMGSRGDFSNYDFQSSDLRNIGFQNSRMKNVNFSDSVLCGCDFSMAILNNSNFTNADIHYACLNGASLEGCDMTGADLRGTELPDGFMSQHQDEQIIHLKSLNINGLKI